MKKTSRRVFGKQLAGALAAIPVASVVQSVGGQVRQRPGDSPITVGGGGGTGVDPKVRSLFTYVEFDHAYYLNTAGNQDERHYKKDGDEPNYIVFDNGLGSVRNLTRYLSDGTVTIKLGDGKKIKITQGGHLGVKLKQTEFDDPTQTNPDRHIRNRTNSQVSIKFKDHELEDQQVGAEWKVCVSKDPMGGGCVTPP